MFNIDTKYLGEENEEEIELIWWLGREWMRCQLRLHEDLLDKAPQLVVILIAWFLKKRLKNKVRTLQWTKYSYEFCRTYEQCSTCSDFNTTSTSGPSETQQQSQSQQFCSSTISDKQHQQPTKKTKTTKKNINYLKHSAFTDLSPQSSAEVYY